MDDSTNGSSKERQKSLTFDKMVEAIAHAIIPGDRPDVFGDASETGRPDGAYQLAWSSYSMLKGRARRSLCPELAIRYNSPDAPLKRKRMADAFRILRRATAMFVFAYSIFLGVNAMLLPEAHHLQAFFILVPGTVLAMLLSLGRNTIGAGRYTNLPESISVDRELVELERMRDLLSGRDFSPSRFLWRCGMEAFTVMMLYFVPSYFTLRWLAGDPLPDVGWSGIVLRLMTAFVMTFLLVRIRKSKRHLADVFHEEIGALNTARMKAYERMTPFPNR